MEKLKHRLQRLRDLQQKKHDKYLEHKFKANKYEKYSFRLMWKVEKVKEELMR